MSYKLLVVLRQVWKILDETISVAPAEGQRPLSMMTDKHSEAMFDPDKFCYGTETFSTNKPQTVRC